jgi:hypothetical protein
MSGVIALAGNISDMGALSSLDLSGNNLGTEGAKVLAKMLQIVFCEDGKRFKRKGMNAQENSGTSVWPAAWSSQYKGMAGRAKSRGVPPPPRDRTAGAAVHPKTTDPTSWEVDVP